MGSTRYLLPFLSLLHLLLLTFDLGPHLSDGEDSFAIAISLEMALSTILKTLLLALRNFLNDLFFLPFVLVFSRVSILQELKGFNREVGSTGIEG